MTVYTGTNNSDTIVGGSGSDTIYGLGGNDLLEGQESLLLSFGDQRPQLIHLHDGSFVGQKCSAF